MSLSARLVGCVSLQSNPAETGLDPHQFDAIRRILKRAGFTDSNTAQNLTTRLAATMDQYRSQTAVSGYGMTPREVDDRLRQLFRLAEQPDAPVGQIRARLKELPPEIRSEIEERAERRWPVYFGEPAPTNLAPGWLANLPRDRLVAILPSAISYGGKMVPGQLRKSGRRSRPHYEPMIRGVVRRSRPSSKSATGEVTTNGAETDGLANGRPRDDDALELISFLAMDWDLATGQGPVPGRSDETPFGDLVHQVFGWLGLPEATGALRRYWREWAQMVERAPATGGVESLEAPR
jgi:hypothetical protein